MSRLKKINKTQWRVLELIINRPHFLSVGKTGISFGLSSEKYPMMRIQNGNQQNAAYKLANDFPDIFESRSISFSIMQLNLLDDKKARDLADYNLDWYGGKA